MPEAFRSGRRRGRSEFLGWRDVPTRNDSLGQTAIASEPVVKQIFIGRSSKLQDDMAFERKLYVIRKQAEAKIRYSSGRRYSFYICSLSHRTLTYRGVLISNQVPDYSGFA